MTSDYSKLERKRNSMPNYINEALENTGLMLEYRNRPAYQQNNYIGWIEEAKKQEAKVKRLSQMLEERELGGIYMKMQHPSSKKDSRINWSHTLYSA